jgi:benzodiazapine receptor
MTLRSFASLAFFILISLAAGFIGSFFTMDQIPTWYQSLTLPSWTPPNWVFGPVWTLLYVLMGTSAYLVSRSKKLGKSFALWLFLAHLVVNLFWSIAFFGMQEILLGLFVILLLLFLILVLMKLFSRYSRTAVWLLVPYLLWVSYATSLNLGILLLN